LIAAFAAAGTPRGAVLVIHENKGLNAHTREVAGRHENKGLNAHTREVAGRLAHTGYTALAIDLLSAEGGTEGLGEPANATAALAKAPPERLLADARAGLDELARRAPSTKLGVVGFCFGGAMTWRLIAVKDPRLAAAAPFYGPMPEGSDFVGAKAAVLGVFAEVDDRVNATRDAAKAALEKAGLVHEVVTFPGQHAFMNDTGPRHHARRHLRPLRWHDPLARGGHDARGDRQAPCQAWAGPEASAAPSCSHRSASTRVLDRVALTCERRLYG
jgi:carboxymethylenebutenolidase